MPYFFLTIVIMLSSALIMVSPASGDVAGDMIKPSVEYRAIYDSNIYRLKDKDSFKDKGLELDQLYDYIHNISARVDAEYTVSKQKLDFTYKKDFMFFSHYSSEDFQEEEISGGVSLNVMDMVTGRLYGGYQRKAQSRQDYRSPERVFQDTDTVGGYLDYRYILGWGIRGGYVRKENGYSPDKYKTSERVTQDYSGNIYYSPSPVYKVFAKFLNRDIDYVNETSRRGDNAERAVSGGIDYKVAGRIILYLDAGYKWKRYNELKYQDRDYDGPVWGVGIDYYITSKLLWSGQMDRDIREEIFLDQIYSELDSWHVSFRYHITDKINTIVGGGRKRYSYKKSDISDPSIEERKDEERKDDMWSASVQILYLPVKAISISLSYSYSSRDSNFDAYIFDAQQVGAGISFRY